jgi:hypothetical protein
MRGHRDKLMGRIWQAGYDSGFADCAKGAHKQVEDALERGVRQGIVLSRVFDSTPLLSPNGE